MLFTIAAVIIYFVGFTDGQFSETNIALNRPAIQYPGDYCEPADRCFIAKLAVDGEIDKIDPLSLEGHCTHTSVQNLSLAYWTVNFTEFHLITGIRVYNRKALQERLRSFSVYGMNGTQIMNKTALYTAGDQLQSNPILIELPELPNVSGIQIQIPYRGTVEKTILTLCEVQIYSDLECPHLQLNNYTIAKYTNETRHGSIVSFSCVHGFEMERNISLVCQGWKWNNVPPRCKKVYCEIPPDLSNGTYEIVSCPENGPTFLPFDCSINPICDTGFNLTRGSLKVCIASKQWSGETPVCDRVRCTVPYLDNGRYKFLNGSSIIQNRIQLDYEDEIFVGCAQGFYIQNNVLSRKCTKDGNWSGPAPDCLVITCEHPGNDSILYGFYTDDSGNRYITGQKNFSQKINVRCEVGYKITNGSSTRICQENMSWSETYAECTIVTCSTLESVKNVVLEYSENTSSQFYRFGSEVNISCVGGKIPDGSKVRRCTAEGSWDGFPSTCDFESEMQSSSSHYAGLIGGVTGGVVGLLIAIVNVLLFLKRRGLLWRQRKPDTMFSDLQNQELSSSAASTPNGQSECTYYDFGDTPAEQYPPTAILVKDLANLVLSGKAANEKFKEQYEALPKGMNGKHLEALKPQNMVKNRYRGLYAYDSSRVELEPDSENENDYINACYINGFKKVQSYIASQGPTKEILTDFWRMVWQVSCRKIVMLTNIKELGKPKCEQYWPDEGGICYGRVFVTITATETFSDFIVRKFTIKKANLEEREVVQYHYTAWPDKGIPKYASSLVQFRNKVKSDEKPGEGPIVVHCSAGVGRTGTFIALDFLTDFAETKGYLDVYGCVETLRRQRVNLVQTLEQYTYLHSALVETLMLSSSALPSSKFESAYQNLLEIDRKSKRRKLDLEFEILRKLSPVTEEDEYISAREVHNRSKNRYSNILPVEEFMPKLTPGNSKGDDYVNAVFLPSYKEKTAFIITQTPLETTREDFWKLVWEYNIHTIVMMNSILEMHKTEIYWPEGKEAVQFGSIHISTDKTIAVDEHSVITLTVTSFSQTRQIKLIQCGGWKPGDNLPESPNVMLSILELVLSWQQTTGNQTILAHCMNGAERSGLFCVISAVIDRMKVEQDVAISSVIEDMRNAREQIIPNVWQYKYCHDVVLAYIKMNETYSNFTI